MRKTDILLLLFVSFTFISACGWSKIHKTTTTGWEYNDSENGGFQKIPFEPMETPPEMVLIEGCDFNQLKYISLQQKFSFTIKDSVYFDSAVSPFFISKYEETNFQYRTYLDFLQYHGLNNEYEKALPDTTVWLEEELNSDHGKSMMKNYFRHPAYDNYPVVGVTSEQAQLYAKWKTDRLNYAILIREGVIEFEEDSVNVFTTEKYLSGEHLKSTTLPDLNPNSKENKKNKLGTRLVRMDDGILFPRLRLMTLSEWQWAVLSIGDAENKYIITPKQMKQSKMDKDKHFSYLYSQKNKSNDEIPAFYQIHSVNVGSVNNYGVYNLNGNVSELIYPDSARISNMGGSWKFPENDYSAIYEKTHPLELNYKIPFEFTYRKDTIQKPNTVTGFRLVMDYIGGIDENIKRKKGN